MGLFLYKGNPKSIRLEISIIKLIDLIHFKFEVENDSLASIFFTFVSNEITL